jgi:hypothetical protein
MMTMNDTIVFFSTGPFETTMEALIFFNNAALSVGAFFSFLFCLLYLPVRGKGKPGWHLLRSSFIVGVTFTLTLFSPVLYEMFPSAFPVAAVIVLWAFAVETAARLKLLWDAHVSDREAEIVADAGGPRTTDPLPSVAHSEESSDWMPPPVSGGETDEHNA